MPTTPTVLDDLTLDNFTYSQTHWGSAWRTQVYTTHPVTGATISATFTGIHVETDDTLSGALGTLDIDDPHADALTHMVLKAFASEYFGRLDNMADSLFESMVTDELGDIIEGAFR